MRFRAFILFVTLTSLLLSACGSVQETPPQLSETARVIVQKTSTPMSIPTSTVESTATQPPQTTQPETTGLVPASPVKLRGSLIYNDHENFYSLDLMSKESSWIIDRPEEWAAFGFIGGPSINGIVYITYSGKTSNNTNEVYELDPVTKQLKRITWDQYEDYYFSMSPDGRLLAYVSDWGSDSEPATRYKINVLDAVKNRISTIAERSHGVSNFVWSPDSKKIALIDLFDEFNSVEIIDIDNREATKYSINAIDLSWSPDGARLAIAIGGDKEKGIYILDTTTGEIVQEINTPSIPVDIAWSPVDDIIGFQLKTKVNENRYSEITSLHLLDLETSEIITMQDNELDGSTREYHLMWSKDGEYIAYFIEPKNVVLWSVDDKKPVLTLELAGYGLPADAIWIYPKVIISVGNDYVITEEGDNLNLREVPSINANILRKIRTEEMVTIIGGPENSDGYTWWQIKTGDNLTGWAVEDENWYELAK